MRIDCLLGKKKRPRAETHGAAHRRVDDGALAKYYGSPECAEVVRVRVGNSLLRHAARMPQCPAWCQLFPNPETRLATERSLREAIRSRVSRSRSVRPIGRGRHGPAGFVHEIPGGNIVITRHGGLAGTMSTTSGRPSVHTGASKQVDEAGESSVTPFRAAAGLPMTTGSAARRTPNRRCDAPPGAARSTDPYRAGGAPAFGHHRDPSQRNRSRCTPSPRCRGITRARWCPAPGPVRRCAAPLSPRSRTPPAPPPRSTAPGRARRRSTTGAGSRGARRAPPARGPDCFGHQRGDMVAVAPPARRTTSP